MKVPLEGTFFTKFMVDLIIMILRLWPFAICSILIRGSFRISKSVLISHWHYDWPSNAIDHCKDLWDLLGVENPVQDHTKLHHRKALQEVDMDSGSLW